MYFTSGSDRAFESLMTGKPGFDHYDSGRAGAPEDCSTCRYYRPDWRYQFSLYRVKFQVKGFDDAMAVFRVERNKGYTVMSNHHLRNKDLSLKAKGLLSQMLSLPESWDYTLKGHRESNAIRTAVWELEQAGYITRQQNRNGRGKMADMIYTIYEQPQARFAKPEAQAPTLEKPVLENPTSDNPMPEKATSENPTQLNKEEQITDQSITDVSSTHSIPILSPPSPLEDGAAQPWERKGKEAATQSAVEIYREIIKGNIEYTHLTHDSRIDRDMLDEIVDLLVETVCSARRTIRVAGDDHPAELVKSKLMKLDSGHIEFVFDCLRENTTKICNFKKYLLAVLFNAPSTINGYYTSLVAHDMATGKI